MSVVEPGEVIEECVFQEWLSPSTRQLDSRIGRQTYIDHKDPLIITKLARVTSPNHHTSPPNHPYLFASNAQMAGT
jgi:hypothetical protein